MTARFFCSVMVPAALLALAFSGCSKRERARIEIDFSDAAEWKYRIAVDLYGTPMGSDSGEYFSGSLRAFLRGLPGEVGVGPLRAGFTDVNLEAPFLPEEERDDIRQRLSDLRLSVSENGIGFSDTAGVPGVLSGGWDILRSPARVIPAMPNADMTVGSIWDREQRFPLALPQGEADALLYQLYTLDSLYKTPDGVPVAGISWVFTYRVAMTVPEDAEEEAGGRGGRRHPLTGSGRGSAVLDLDRKKLLSSKAAFQVTHSSLAGMDINEVVHFEMVE